jgi:HEXXH motif-containing protein
MQAFELPQSDSPQGRLWDQVQRLESVFRKKNPDLEGKWSRPELAWKTLGKRASSGDWKQGCLERIRDETIQDIGRDPHFRLGNPCSETALQQCQLALEFLEKTGAAFAEEIRIVARQVVLFQATDFYSTSALYAHGSIWMNPQKHWRTAHYIDTLLHESGHLILMLTQVEGRILENSFERMRSPLRTDSRPMVGVFHALYVLDRIYQGLKAYLQIPGIPDREIAEKLSEDYRRRFEESWPEFEARAIPTPRGREILNGLSLRRSLKNPSETLRPQILGTRY